MKKVLILTIVFTLATISIYAQSEKTLEVVAELEMRPGNVAVNQKDRVFTTIHPLGNPNTNLQLVEITGKDSFEPFPNAEYQSAVGKSTDDQFDSLLGIRIDNNNTLWVIDMGLNLGKTRLFGFDVATKEEIFRFDFPENIAPKGSFIQDLAVDEINGWVYLADISDPGILALNTKTKELRRFSDETVQAEKVDMIINEKLINFGGAPASVAINPITLSADRNTLYYGAMNGTTWYKVDANLFRNGASNYEISKAIKVAGPKPLSDGVATGQDGNHYITNIQHNGIDVLTSNGELKPFYRNEKIDWPDNVALDSQGNIYLTVNQLHKSPPFTGGADEAKPPFYIFKIDVN